MRDEDNEKQEHNFLTDDCYNGTVASVGYWMSGFFTIFIIWFAEVFFPLISHELTG